MKTPSILRSLRASVFFIRIISLFLSCLLLASCGEGNKDKPFHLATFSADVTPPLGHTLFTGGWEKAESILAPLEARGFVLIAPNDKPLVFCSIDWAEIRNDAHQRWREVLAEAAGTDPTRVMICAIHQHDTPLADVAAEIAQQVCVASVLAVVPAEHLRVSDRNLDYG